MLLLQLLVVVAAAHQISGCCLPESFQVTMLSETVYGGSYRSRGKMVTAVDPESRRAGFFSESEHGYVYNMYVDFNTGKVYHHMPSYGCYESAIDMNLVHQMNQSRCIPRELLTQRPMPIRLAGNVNALFYSGSLPADRGFRSARNATGNSTNPGNSTHPGNSTNPGNSTTPPPPQPSTNVDVLISERCEPILVKISGQGYDSINIFGDLLARPAPGLLNVPDACRRGAGNSTGRRRRSVVNLGFGSSPFMF